MIDNFKYPNTCADAYILNGYQMLVRGDVFRGRYRNSYEKPKAFVPSRITDIKYAMNDVAHTFGKGHHIMVRIQSGWFPLVDRNPQNDVNNTSNIILPILK